MQHAWKRHVCRAFVGIPEGRSLEDLDINGSIKLKEKWNT
jgi:hypothetical protein